MLRRAVELRPMYADGWANLAETHELRGDAARRGRRPRTPASLQPDSARAWGRRGVLAYQAGQLDAARACFAEATRLAAERRRSLDQPRRRPASARAARGRPRRSQRRAVALRPDFVDALNNLGNVLVARSRWTEAAAILEQVAQRAPHDPNGWVNLGHALQGAGAARGCPGRLRAALALRPDDPAALVGLGDALQGLGDFAPGDRLLSAGARAVMPDDPETHEHLGVALPAARAARRGGGGVPRQPGARPRPPDDPQLPDRRARPPGGRRGRGREQRRRWNARFGRRADGQRIAASERPDPDRRSASATSRPTSATTRPPTRSCRSCAPTTVPGRGRLLLGRHRPGPRDRAVPGARRPLARRGVPARTTTWRRRSGPTRSTSWWTSPGTPGATGCRSSRGSRPRSRSPPGATPPAPAWTRCTTSWPTRSWCRPRPALATPRRSSTSRASSATSRRRTRRRLAAAGR